MPSSPNWSALMAQDRCKQYGVPWSEKEAYALYELKIPADYVREGVLTLAQYEVRKNQVVQETDQKGKPPLQHMKKDALLAYAAELDISIGDEMTRSDLIGLIRGELSKPKLALPADSPESVSL